MSFILEALRKSEHERQRKIGPSLADVQIRPQRSEKPWWAFAVGALLLINLAVLLVVLIRGGDAKQTEAPAQTETLSPPAATPAPTRNTAVAATPPPAYSPRPTSSPSPLAAEAARSESAYSYPPEQPDLAAAAAVPDGPPIVRPIQPPTVAPARTPAQARMPAPEENEVLPTLSELSGSGMSLPDLHLDIHVHSPDPSQRFIFVNMRKYVEGQTLSEGPTIERITADGVILNHRGMRFLLPRQ